MNRSNIVSTKLPSTTAVLDGPRQVSHAIPATILATNAYSAAPRLSGKSLLGIVLAHLGVLALLMSLEVVPIPPALTTLMVQVIPPVPPAEKITPPRPTPVERKPVVRPTPQQQAPTLATESVAPSAAEVPAAKSPPPSPAPAAAATVTQARFDADYLQNPAPAYPPLSKRMGEEGKVVLRVFVEPDGRPSQINVSTGSGSPRLDQAALDAVWRWKFVAARRGDEAIAAWVLVPILFNLKN